MLSDCVARGGKVLPIVLTVLLVSTVIALAMCTAVRRPVEKAGVDAACGPGGAVHAGEDPALKEAKARFAYKGRPIHPKLVKQFVGWSSDVAPPVVVTVDVSASLSARNEYYVDSVREDGGRVFWEYDENMWPVHTPWFAYERLGAMADGTQVLKTYDCGGGSLVFTDLVLVRFKAPEPGRLLMHVVKRAGMGSGNPAKIDVLGERVIVGPGSDGIEQWDGFEIALDDLR